MSLALHRSGLRLINLIERPGVRYRWIQRGRDPAVAKNLAQKMQEWEIERKNPELHFSVNIGYAYARPSRKSVLTDRLQHRNNLKNDIALQKAAQNRTLKLSVAEVAEEWLKTIGPYHIKETAEYYGIYESLFGEAYFFPVIHLDICYSCGLTTENNVIPIQYGNLVRPYEAVSKPQVKYNAKADELYTLMLTTPDGHLTSEKSEYIHWLVGNIPGSSIEKGQELCDYMQPFPARGIGYCRYIFVLFKQDKRLDYSQYQRELPCKNLTARTFSTYDFYREFQDYITPAGLSFFQADWDQTLSKFFHEVLEMKEPVFEYDFAPMTVPEPKWFPHKKPFNLYLDKYKDPKELQKELLIEKLKERHPFNPPPKPPKYPLALPVPRDMATWRQDDLQLRRMKEGKWKFM